MKVENKLAISCLEEVSRFATVCGEDDYFHYCEFQNFIQSKIKKLKEEV